MKNYYILILFVTLCISCKNSPEPSMNATEKLPQDFVDFYEKFLQDSSYQMNHIQFPLEGIPNRANPETDDLEHFRWKQEDWVLHHDFDPQKSGFNRNFIIVTEDLIQENVVHKNHKYALERRFSKSNGKWQLIYYAGLNEVKE